MIKENLENIRNKIQMAAEACGRRPEEQQRSQRERTVLRHRSESHHAAHQLWWRVDLRQRPQGRHDDAATQAPPECTQCRDDVAPRQAHGDETATQGEGREHRQQESGSRWRPPGGDHHGGADDR